MNNNGKDPKNHRHRQYLMTRAGKRRRSVDSSPASGTVDGSPIAVGRAAGTGDVLNALAPDCVEPPGSGPGGGLAEGRPVTSLSMRRPGFDVHPPARPKARRTAELDSPCASAGLGVLLSR